MQKFAQPKLNFALTSSFSFIQLRMFKTPRQPLTFFFLFH
jgi:hypothetical protein